MRAKAQGVYAARPSMILDINVREGQTVAAGTILAHLSSPNLEYQLQAAVAEEAALHWQVDQQPFDEELRKQGPALRKQ